MKLGFSYQYLSPDNFDLSLAQVRNKILAPEAQGFRAMVVRANDSLTVSGATKLAEFAHAGLPIVFSGGIPQSYLGTNQESALVKAQTSLNQTVSLSNVHVTDTYDGLASTLAAIGINPTTSISTTGSWYTAQRLDSATGVVYYYVYNDAMESLPGQGSSKGTITFSSTGIPYELDAWTGEQMPILTYTQTADSTSIPFTLAGNQSTIVAFLPRYQGAAIQANTHLTYLSDSILGSMTLDNGSIALKVGPGSGAASYSLTTGGLKFLKPISASSITITNWTLIVEHWDPPTDLYDIEGGAVKQNTTHALQNLVSWQQIPGLENVSGRGYYSASFQWPAALLASSTSKPDGAIIDFGSVVHTLRASINGRLLPPLDVTSAKTDISQWLVQGENKVEAVVATPLGNVLRPIWDQLQTSGTGPTDPVGGGPPPPIVNYGMLNDVVVTPYKTAVVS